MNFDTILAHSKEKRLAFWANPLIYLAPLGGCHTYFLLLREIYTPSHNLSIEDLRKKVVEF